MASPLISKAHDRLDEFLHRQRGSIGSPRAVELVKRLSAMQRHVQENGRSIRAYAQINIYMERLEDILGMGSE